MQTACLLVPQLVGPKEATRAALWVDQKAQKSVGSSGDLWDVVPVGSKAGSLAVRMAWMSVHRQAEQTAAQMAWYWGPPKADLRAERWAVQRAAPKVD